MRINPFYLRLPTYVTAQLKVTDNGYNGCTVALNGNSMILGVCVLTVKLPLIMKKSVCYNGEKYSNNYASKLIIMAQSVNLLLPLSVEFSYLVNMKNIFLS